MRESSQAEAAEIEGKNLLSVKLKDEGKKKCVLVLLSHLQLQKFQPQCVTGA